VRIMNLRYYFL
jgi:6-phosphofructokinase 1